MKKGLVYFGGIVIFLSLLYLAWNRDKEMNDEVKGVKKVEAVDETKAGVISESILKALMKFPDDVVIDRSTKKVISEPDSVYKVTGHLKANNVFGQAIPYIYNIRIKYTGGDWSEFRGGRPINWSLIGGNIYNEATQEITEF
jgi:hypothetical protein